MKTKVNENKNEKEIEFPCLMVTDSGTIILAIGIDKNGIDGFVLKDNVPLKRAIGYHSETWNLNTLNPFKGSITLSND